MEKGLIKDDLYQAKYFKLLDTYANKVDEYEELLDKYEKLEDECHELRKENKELKDDKHLDSFIDKIAEVIDTNALLEIFGNIALLINRGIITEETFNNFIKNKKAQGNFNNYNWGSCSSKGNCW